MLSRKSLPAELKAEEEVIKQAKEKKQAEEDLENGFDPKELVQSFDGWEFYKRKKTGNVMVKRYCQTLDQDYTKNKITVCAHLDHILNLFNNQRKPFMRTMADGLNIERQKSI